MIGDRKSLFSWMFLFVCWSQAPQCNADERDRLDEIFSAWASQSANVQAGRFSWETVVGDGFRGPESPKGMLQHYSEVSTFTFGAGRRRLYHIVGKQVDPFSGKLMSLNNLYSDDGNGEWREFTPPCERFDYPVGFIEGHSWGMRDLFPILLCFGKLPPGYVLDRKRMRVIDTDYPINGGRGILLLESRTTKNTQRSLVVDPTKSYAILRYSVSTLSGQLEYQFDIEYKRAELDQYVPHGWRYVNFDADGTPSVDKKVVVTDFELNPKVSEGVFRLEFPVGTVVYDVKANEHFVQRGDGKRRVITPAENKARLSYPKLMETESGMGVQLQGVSGPWRLILVIVNALALVVIVGFVCWQRCKRRSESG